MSRSRSYCFTLNNYNDDDLVYLRELSCRYLIFGFEVGQQGTPHLQGYVYFDAGKSLSAAKKLISSRAHLETLRGTPLQAITYCKKEGNFEEYGEPPSQGKRTDLEQVTTLIKEGASVTEVATQFPVQYVKFYRGINSLKYVLSTPYEHYDVRGLWYFGKPGTGKSSFARTFPDIYLKPQNKWWDGYDGQTTVILDDLDLGGECLGHLLKIWSDRYSCTGETKGGTVHLRHHRLIVTSNFSMDQIFGSSNEILSAVKRRFVSRDFDKFPYDPTTGTTSLPTIDVPNSPYQMF